MIVSSTKNIRDILNQGTRYVVPDYQRNFEWKKENATDFWEDAIEGKTFLGTFVFDISKIASEKKCIIVDGQQRLTTIFILLSACRNRAKQLRNIDQAIVIQEKLSFKNDTSGKSTLSKLETSESVKEVFEKTIISYDWDGKTFNFKNKNRQSNKIKPLYEFFTERVNKLNSKDLEGLLENIYSSTVVCIEIQDTQEAFDIFERTNARGMELNAADLLKNYLFSREAANDLKNVWENIVDNSSNNIVRMIKYFHVSKFGLVSKRKLFSEIKKYGEENSAEKLLQEINEFSYLFSIIIQGTYEDIIEWGSKKKLDEFSKEHNAKSLNRSFDALRLFGVTQGYPLIIKIMEFIPLLARKEHRKIIEKSFLKLAVSIEKYHFINNAISQRPGNEVEKYYADKCKENLNERNIKSFIESIIQDLKKKIVSESEFIERFSEVNYENDFPLIYYINDRLNNYNRKGGQVVEIYNPDKRIIKKNYNIEHLIPKNLEEYSFNREDFDNFIDNIGNLLVISLHTNSELRNKPLFDKLKILKDKDAVLLPEVNIFIKKWSNKDWTKLDSIKKNIQNRSQELGKRSLLEVWKI